jgi:hypothetical protein
MSQLTRCFYLSITLLLIFLCTIAKAQDYSKPSAKYDAIDKHISSLQKSIDSLAVTVFKDMEVKTDTVKNALKISGFTEKNVEPNTIKSRIDVLQTSLKNINEFIVGPRHIRCYLVKELIPYCCRWLFNPVNHKLVCVLKCYMIRYKIVCK